MQEIPSKLDMFLAEVTKTGTSESSSSVHSVTTRIPSIDFATIEALARTSGMARNKVIVSLLEAAIEQMWKGLDPEMHDAISHLQGMILRELIEDDEGNIKTLEQGKKGGI